MLSCQSHGVALTICELGNGTWSVPFPDRAQALLRETVACRPKVYRGGKTEGVASLLGSFHEGGKEMRVNKTQNEKKEIPWRFPFRVFPCYWTINQPDCS